MSLAMNWGRRMECRMNQISMTSLLAFAFLPMVAAAQQDPVERLAAVLPEDVAAQVLSHIEAARVLELPVQAAANLALEGVAKGRSGAEVLAAVELLVGDMAQARAALQSAGRPPEEGEVEAATAAMRMGVDAESISALAQSQSQASGRTLAVPLLVMAGLAERGWRSGDALAAVAERLQARADDAALLGDFPEVAHGLGQQMRPEEVGPALASGLHGFQVPVSGVTVPVGPQSGNARPPAGRGRGSGPGGG
jgi:hypothetical protein